MSAPERSKWLDRAESAKDMLGWGVERVLGKGAWSRCLELAGRARAGLAAHSGILFFCGGFGFDALTLDRIDAWIDLGTQGAYLAGITAVLVLQQRRGLGLWAPEGRWERAWTYNLEALHFLFGGLLSAYVIFYTKSGVSARSFVFFAVIAVLLVYNELPGARRWGLSLRMALYTFCLASYLIYLVPVLKGSMGDAVFLLSMGLTAVGVTGLTGVLLLGEADRRAALKRLAVPAAVTLSVVTAVYFLRLIPPVPLSLKFIGIYHKVERRGDSYSLTYEKGPWYAPFRRQDRPYLAGKGDRIYCFVRIFAPTRFSHKVTLHWMQRDPHSGGWVSRDRIPLDIRGGRDQGYRGYAFKAHYTPGRWRVQVETEDRRVIGKTGFKVRESAAERKRRWKVIRS